MLITLELKGFRNPCIFGFVFQSPSFQIFDLSWIFGSFSLWSFWHKPRPCAFCFTKKHGNIFKTKTQYLFVKLVLVLKKKNQLSIWTPPRDYHLNGAPHVGTGG